MRRSIEGIIQLPRRRVLSVLELHAAAIGLIAATVFVVGWGLGVEIVQSVLPGFPTMRPRTALTFVVLALSCLLSLRPSKHAQAASSVLAVGAMIWAASLAVSNWGAETNGESVHVPIQATLLSLILGGVAMLIVNLAPKLALWAGAIALAAATPALYRIFTLLLFRGAPEEGSLLSSMAIHTAVLIVWFMSACVLLHPRLGFGEALLQPSLRGRVLRRALPFVALLPAVAGAMSLALSVVFGWPEEVLFGLTATLSVTLGASLAWWLSDIVAQWQADANEHAARLSRANEALEQYASSAAHDLKAPVRHMLLYGELLDEALGRGDAAAARKNMENIRASAAELPPIIEGMLEFSRGGAIRPAPAGHALSELVQAAIALQEADLRSAGAHVTVEREAAVWCDATLMTTVFQNLIANSVRNRRGDRPAEIRIDAQRDGEMWLISVADNGAGFDPDFAAVAFNPLARGVRLAGDGPGIGLATCRTIVQSHGGSIRVDPAFRGGARIEVRLPVKPAPEIPATRHAGETTGRLAGDAAGG